MSTVSTFEFTSSLPLTCKDSPESAHDWHVSSFSFAATRPDSEQATARPKKLDYTRKPASSHRAEDLAACVGLIVAGIGSVFLVGLLAAHFYASLMQYSPFEIVRALGGLH